MFKSGRFLLLPLLVCTLLTGSAGQSLAQIKELPVYNEWQGRNSTFKAERPFFLIRDIHDLNRFWASSGSDEPTPGIDFAKYMLLVWCPGASLFDYVPVSVERFIYKEGNYFALMAFDRKDTGGYWRNPFMATMLPLVTSGDIFIMRKVVVDAHRIDWKPVFTLWDMSGERKRPFEVAQIEQPPEKVEFIAHAPESIESKPSNVSVAVNSNEASSEVQSRPSQVSTLVSAGSSNSGRASAGFEAKIVAVTSAVATSSTTQSSAIADWPDATPAVTPTPAAVAQPVQKIDEDPLFGSEFDITF